MKEKLLFSLLVAEWLDGDRWIEVRPFWEEYPETGRTAGARVGFMPERPTHTIHRSNAAEFLESFSLKSYLSDTLHWSNIPT